jgi:hypothetical protein
MVTFIDDYSRYTVCYLIQRKDDVAKKFREYIAEVSKKFRRKLKILRSDNGGGCFRRKLTLFEAQRYSYTNICTTLTCSQWSSRKKESSNNGNGQMHAVRCKTASTVLG